jgi:propionyl-CoA synthetase
MASMTSYRDAFERSITDPHAFWGEQAALVDWISKPQRVLDDDAPPFYRWFPDATLNTCYNALDRHVVNGRAEQPALVYDSPVTGGKATFTYAEMVEKVAAFAGVLRGLGVEKGDRVLVYMPMIPEAVVAMLACARIGAVHSVVFGGFAAHELAVRIDDARPTVVVAASCGVEPTRVVEYKPLLDRALDAAGHRPAAVVVKQRPQAEATLVEGRDLDWDLVMRAGATDPAPCVEVAATDPLYVLYTSGTTGKPKGIVRDNGGHAVALAWSLPNIYDIHPGQVWWAASDVGWVVGHSYIVYAPLLCGATTVLYEGKPVGTPDAGAFWRVVAEHGVEGLFTAPTAIRAIKKEDPEGRLLADHDIGSLRTLFLAGERLDPDTYEWARRTLAYRWSTTGGRPRPGGRSRRTCAASSRWRSRPAPRRSRSRGTTCRCLTATEGVWIRAWRARSASGCRCRPARSRRCGVTTSGSSRRTSPRTRATTCPATAGTSTRTATSSSWAAPTTSSTSPATGCRPAPWRR